MSALATVTPRPAAAEGSAPRVRAAMRRMRTRPRPWDYCWWTARTNRAALDALLAAARPDERTRVVDVGCGRKPFRELFPAGCAYLGVDVGDAAAADLVHDLSRPLPLPDASADVVLLSEVLEHVEDPRLVLAEACRIAAPGARILVTTPFAFPIHGRPYDFQRFTEHFFRALPERLPVTIERFECSNCAPTTPLLLVSQLLLSAPALPWWAKQLAWLGVNALAAPLELLLGRLAGRPGDDGRVASFLRSNPAGYALVLQRTRQRVVERAGC